MKKSNDELALTAVSIGLLLLIITFSLGNIDNIEMLFETKVKSRWIGY